MQKFSIGRFFMYLVLFIYAGISIVPFLVMLITSVMTGNELSAGEYIPRGIDTKTDITSCFVVSRDTFRDETGEIRTGTRLLVDIPDDIAGTQGYGFRGSGVRSNVVESRELFRFPFFTNYCEAWDSADLGDRLWATIRLVILQVVGTLLFSIPAAYAFARINFAGKNLIFTVMLATLMIPSIVAILPNLLILTRFDAVLKSSFLCRSAEVCIMNNWPAMIIPFLTSAFTIFLLRQHFMTIPDELWDAARIDGATHLRFMLQIVVPLSKSIILVIVLFAFIGAWNELAWPLLVTSGPKGAEWRPIAVGLNSFLQEEGNFAHLQMAGSMITIFPILMLYAFTQRYFIEGISSSGLKG